MHPVLGFFHATKGKEGFAFQVKDVLFRDGGDGRAFSTCEDTGEMAANYGVVLAHFAGDEQIFNLLFQNQARTGTWEDHHCRLSGLPLTCFTSLGQADGVGFGVT